jgi:hypothetical protein
MGLCMSLFMWKKLLVSIFILSALSTFLVIQFGLRPKSVPVIRPSNFENPEKLSFYIYRQMFQVLSNSQVIAFGVHEADSYHLKVVEDLKIRLGSSKEYYILKAEDAYHKLPNAKIHEIEKNKNLQIPSFIFENLDNVKVISQLQDCSNDLRFTFWLECLKENKLRQIFIAKRVKENLPAAVFERVSERDWVSFIKK